MRMSKNIVVKATVVLCEIPVNSEWWQSSGSSPQLLQGNYGKAILIATECAEKPLIGNNGSSEFDSHHYHYEYRNNNE
mgnify:CR=1 FL=1